MGKKKKIVDNIMVHFGSMFEEISVMLFEKEFNTKIFAKNISLIDPSNLNYFIFSPDGVCTMPKTKNKIVLEKMNDDRECCPVLIEIKNPWSRQIIQDGDVPPVYLAQVQAGLIAIPMLHAGIFIDTQTKLCSYEQLGDIGYNEELHKNKSRLVNEVDPIARGIIFISGTLPKDFWKKDCETIDFGGKKVLDLGDCRYMNIISILRSAKEGKLLNIKYGPLYDNTDELNDDFNNNCNIIQKENIIGIMCYKIYDISYTICYRDTQIITDIRNVIKEYSTGELDIDEDYIERKRKRSSRNQSGMPSIDFDFNEDKKKENLDDFSFDSS